MAHNLSFESQAPVFVKERNQRFLKAYEQLITVIDRIQGYVSDEFLRMRIESDMKQKPGIQSTIFQCTTPWCIISLGCDTMGRYNLAYSVDHRIQQMIGEEMATTFIRRVYEFTPGDMGPFVRIGCLYQDCVELFQQLLKEQEQEAFHKVLIKDLNK